MTMKTKQILLSASVLLVAACEKSTKQATSDRATYYHENSGVLESGTLLSNGLPPEMMEGTPVPIVLSGLLATSVPPEQTPGPGTLGVSYGLMEEHP